MELTHRVNNLLGTIEIQAEVARDAGSVDAYAAALSLIEESARRTRDDLQRLMHEPGDSQPSSEAGSGEGKSASS